MLPLALAFACADPAAPGASKLLAEDTLDSGDTGGGDTGGDTDSASDTSGETGNDSGGDTAADTAGDTAEDTAGDTAEETVSANAVPDFLLTDENAYSPRWGQAVSPRDYLEQVSGWYFIHAT